MDARWQGLSETMKSEEKQADEYTVFHSIIPYGFSIMISGKQKKQQRNSLLPVDSLL